MATAPPSSHVAPIRTAVVWLEPDQVDLLRCVIDSLDDVVTVVAAGCPQPGRAREVAEALGASRATGDVRGGTRRSRGNEGTAGGGAIMGMDDLRAALTTSDADLFLLAAPGEFGSGGEGGGGGAGAGGASGLPGAAGGGGGGGAADWAVIDQRRAAGGAMITLEPMPASVLQLHTPTLGSGPEQPAVVLGPGDPLSAAAGGSGAGEWASFAPSFRRGPAMRAAADVLAQLGPIHTVNAEFVSGRGEGSLGARLFDAFETVTSLLGDAETVDAMYVWPGRGRIVHPTVGESLRGLSGIMTANCRFPAGRAATVLAGDHTVGCARWSRRLTVIGEGGRLIVSDDGFELFTADGQSHDRSAPVLAGGEGRSLAGAVLADQIRRTLELAPPAAPPTDYARVLSATGAAVLSARTGEAESPETILRMARTG